MSPSNFTKTNTLLNEFWNFHTIKKELIEKD